jgi:hypothetical protein
VAVWPTRALKRCQQLLSASFSSSGCGLPNQRLQRAGARGSRVAWLVSAPEVGQLLCGWRAVARR